VWLIFKESSNQCATVSVTILSQFVNTAFVHESYCPLMPTTQGWGKYDSDSRYYIYIVLHMTWWFILKYNFDKIHILYNNCASPSVFLYSGVSFTYFVKFSWWSNRVILTNCGLLPLCNVFRLQKIGLSLQACCWNIVLSHNYKQCSDTNLKTGSDPAPRTWCCIYYINLNALDDGKSHEVNHYGSVSHVWQITSFI